MVGITVALLALVFIHHVDNHDLRFMFSKLSTTIIYAIFCIFCMRSHSSGDLSYENYGFP